MKQLSEGHWVHEDYRERIPAAQWREILLSNADHIIYRGCARTLIVENLGYGVVEVFKKPLGAKP